MPRLTVYIPDELALELRTFPGEMNVSKVCAAALRAELSARGTDRSIEGLFAGIAQNPSYLERALMNRYGLRIALVGNDKEFDARDTVAFLASRFLDQTFMEGLRVGMGGGRQMWEIARRLQPRNLGITAWALGFGMVDHEMPHVHPNALVTLLSMLYGSRTKTMLVGAPHFERTWSYPAIYPPGEPVVHRLMVGSCAMFDADSPYARVLGKEITDFLAEENVMGDFLGVFITPDGRTLQPYTKQMTVSHIMAADLERFAQRNDALVLMASGGGQKVRLMRTALELKLCNALITDVKTARALL